MKCAFIFTAYLCVLVKVPKWSYFDVDCVFESFCENGTWEAVHYLYSLGNVNIHFLVSSITRKVLSFQYF